MITGCLTALGGALPRPRARPYALHMNAPCVLASHSPITPSQRVII
jgi:hypothetical protein